MQATPSINAIKDLINQLETGIPEVVPEEGRYGMEQEHTHQELLDELARILVDLRTLTESPKQFLSLLTFDDRDNIKLALKKAMAVLPSPGELFNYIDQIKTTIRPFNIRHTEERFFTTQNKLAELEEEKTKLQRILYDMRRDIKTVKQNIFKSEEILQTSQQQQQAVQQQQQDLTEKLANTESQVQESQNHASEISEFKNTVDSYKPDIDAFMQEIADREQQLEDQKSRTDEYNERLVEFSDEHKNRLKEAEALIEKAKTALEYQQAVGISAAFKTRLNRLEDVKWWKSENTVWLFAAIAFSGIAIYLGYELIQAIGGTSTTDSNGTSHNITLASLIARFSVMTLPIAAVWFCVGQYTKNKNVAEDYAYKTVLAQSIIGFSEQLKNDDQSDTSYLDYVKKMLDEIHQHPLKNHKKHSTSDYSPLKLWRSKEDKSVDE